MCSSSICYDRTVAICVAILEHSNDQSFHFLLSLFLTGSTLVYSVTNAMSDISLRKAL